MARKEAINIDRASGLNNTQRATLLSFLTYFVMSGMLAPMGILSGPMSEYFGESVAAITASFSWLTVGILVGAVIAMFIFDLVKLKRLLIIVFSVIVASLASLLFIENLTFVGVALGLVGICCGIALPGAAFIISKTYDTEKRASMLIITDACFSAAGIFCSWLAISMIARSFHWSGVYQFVAIVAVGIVFLAMLSTLPETDADRPIGSAENSWPANVWICAAALFLYTLGQWSLLLWLPNYAETQLGVSRDQSGQLVSLFWTGLFASQLFVAWWVMKIGVRRLLVIAGLSTTLLSVPLWINRDIEVLIVLAAIWGFANLGILKVILSFGTQMVSKPSARLVAGLLLGATAGTAVAPWITSQIVVLTNSHFVLQFGTACYVLMTALLVIVSSRQRRVETAHAIRPR